MTADDEGLAVWIAGVIDQAGRIGGGGSIQIVALIEGKDINGGTAGLFGLLFQSQTAACAFGLGDLFTDIFNDWPIFGDVADGKDTTLMNGGSADDPLVFFGGFRHEGKGSGCDAASGTKVKSGSLFVKGRS